MRYLQVHIWLAIAKNLAVNVLLGTRLIALCIRLGSLLDIEIISLSSWLFAALLSKSCPEGESKHTIVIPPDDRGDRKAVMQVARVVKILDETVSTKMVTASESSLMTIGWHRGHKTNNLHYTTLGVKTVGKNPEVLILVTAAPKKPVLIHENTIMSEPTHRVLSSHFVQKT